MKREGRYEDEGRRGFSLFPYDDHDDDDGEERTVRTPRHGTPSPATRRPARHAADSESASAPEPAPAARPAESASAPEPAPAARPVEPAPTTEPAPAARPAGAPPRMPIYRSPSTPAARTPRVTFTQRELAEAIADADLEDLVVVCQDRLGTPKIVNLKNPPEWWVKYSELLYEKMHRRLPNMAPFWVVGRRLYSREKMEEIFGEEISIHSRLYQCHFVEIDDHGAPIKEEGRYIEIADYDVIDEWLEANPEENY